jgi:hypothetical protein
MTDPQTSPCCIEWIVIPAPDVEKGRLFYSKVFGFTFREFTPDFLTFQAGNIRGALNAQLPVAEGGVLFSITVDDMDEAVSRITREGGAILSDPQSLGTGAGSWLRFRDPNGVELELFSPS